VPILSSSVFGAAIPHDCADYLTTYSEYDNKQRREDGVSFKNSGQNSKLQAHVETGL